MIATSKPKIIGISGKMGVGKNYYTRFLVEYLKSKGESVIELAFSDQLKINALISNDGLLRNNVYLKKTNESRIMLQQEGTEKGRDVHGYDIWVRYLSEWMYLFQQRGFEYFVISDVRFKNEANFILNRKGCLIRINAPELNKVRLENEYSPEKCLEIKEHLSETELDSFESFSIQLTNTLDPIQTEKNKVLLMNELQRF